MRVKRANIGNGGVFGRRSEPVDHLRVDVRAIIGSLEWCRLVLLSGGGSVGQGGVQ